MNQDQPSRHYTVFIADDDVDDVFFVQTAIRELDLNIDLVHFPNGRDLINRLLTRDLPDLIILDLNMPVLDGMETLKLIRENEQLMHVPMVILSTSTFSHERKNCLDNGANDYFTKPYSFNSYVEIITRLKKDYMSAEVLKT